MNKKIFLNPYFWNIIIDLAPGVRNLFLYLLKIEKIYTPYIPVPGIRQIIAFFKNDSILEKSFEKYLKDPYKNIDYRKKVYLLLNYSGNISEIESSIKELPKKYLLNKALENIDEFGLIALKFDQYKDKFKSVSQKDMKKLFKKLSEIKEDGEKLKALWESSRDF